VGEIEDEFDVEADAGDIYALADRSYRVSGDAAIEHINEAFGVNLSDTIDDTRFETIGGLISHTMGHVPKRGEACVVGGLSFAVLHTKGGAVKWFKVAPSKVDEAAV
jgi:magnesium and cobalt transporter